MQYTFATLLTFAAAAAAQNYAPGGVCSDTVSGKFLLTPLNVTLSEQNQARSLEERDAICEPPTVTLQNGVLTDQSGATGEIVANNQLQFDHILQPGRLFDTGFCIYPNRSLAVGGSAIFYSCISGDFSNLYNKDIGSVCSQVYLNATICEGGSPAGVNTASVGVSGSSSSTSSTTSSTSSTTSTTPTTTPTTTPVSTHPTPKTSASPPPPPPPPATTPTPAPYPVGNTTAPAHSGSAAGTGSKTTSVTSTTAGTSKTSPATFQPSSGANVLAIGSQLIAGIAAVGAFALF